MIDGKPSAAFSSGRTDDFYRVYRLNKNKKLQKKKSYQEEKQMDEKRETVRPRGTDSIKVILAIKTKAIMEAGVEKGPNRLVRQYWTFDRNLLAISYHLSDMPNQLIFKSLKRVDD